MSIPNHYYLVVVSEKDKGSIDTTSIPSGARDAIMDIFADESGLVCISQGPSKKRKVLVNYSDTKLLSQVITDKNGDVYFLTSYEVVITEQTLKYVNGKKEPKVVIHTGLIYGAKQI